jgi:hypothetical protein
VARNVSGAAVTTGFFDFLCDVLASDHKTRRLGYLIRQVAIAASLIVGSMAVVGYITMYRVPIAARLAVPSASILIIIFGNRSLRRSGRASRDVTPPSATEVGGGDDPNQIEAFG